MDFFRWRPHPWHGLDLGKNAPSVVNLYLELTPFDSMKYEVDKITGYLRLDRPQLGSSLPPCSYGFIPRTYSAKRVAALARGATIGDKDPLDVFLISEPPITRAEIVVSARILGGLRTIDGGEVDDKLIAVLEKDPVWERATQFSDLPTGLIARIRHYLTTSKQAPGPGPAPVKVEESYDRDHARQVVEAGVADYIEHYLLPSSSSGFSE